ncbi:MAG: hypothetical protein M1821_005170 [Bathelium mastoideum]|nr:MAG: hypothetical protein M1821_005170 [Bathelium mastoideum]
MSVQIAAFAPVAGAVYTNNTGTCYPYTIEPVNTIPQPLCSPGRSNLPIIEFHGTADPTINYLGGQRRRFDKVDESDPTDDLQSEQYVFPVLCSLQCSFQQHDIEQFYIQQHNIE